MTRIRETRRKYLEVIGLSINIQLIRDKLISDKI